MALPPAQPAYILRGHGSQISTTAFIRSNTRLLTGDSDGWIVLWSLATKRPVAVWRAHEGSILGINAWGSEKLITCVALHTNPIESSTICWCYFCFKGVDVSLLRCWFYFKKIDTSCGPHARNTFIGIKHSWSSQSSK